MPQSPDAKRTSTPPDGGWGWVVVFGAFISIGFSYSFSKALTVFFKDIQQDFHVSYSDIAWVASIMLATMYAGGPLSGVLVQRFGSRPVTMAGGCMCGLSMVAASFGTSIIHLYVTIGLVGGLGLSLNLNASLTIISQYFLVRRPLANGLAMTGSPVFLCFLAPLNQYFLSDFGWRGSFLILGALLLHCCVAGALMRPLPSAAPRSSSAAENGSRKDAAENGSGKDVSRGTRLRSDCWRRFDIVDLSLFRDRGFVIYLIGNAAFFFGAYAPIVFLSAYAVSRGVDQFSAASLLSVMGFVDMFTRPGTGLLANTRWVRPRIQYFLSFAMIFNGTCHLLCPLATSYAGLVVYAAFFGVGFGMVFALIFECLMDLMGPERFPKAIGLVTIIECCPMLLGPPTAGENVHHQNMLTGCSSVCLSVTFTALEAATVVSHHAGYRGQSPCRLQGSVTMQATGVSHHAGYRGQSPCRLQGSVTMQATGVSHHAGYRGQSPCRLQGSVTMQATGVGHHAGYRGRSPCSNHAGYRGQSPCSDHAGYRGQSPCSNHAGYRAALVDTYSDFRYLFLMCGAVILSGGLFLLVMNVYNYRLLDRKGRDKDQERQQQQGRDIQQQDRALKHESEESPLAPGSGEDQTGPPEDPQAPGSGENGAGPQEGTRDPGSREDEAGPQEGTRAPGSGEGEAGPGDTAAGEALGDHVKV
ncbi:hypothetical protein NHX12_030942 [Muraenolepis orangiensis]|uniref:Major facilitator superfamily (MFS) profile domain-containing protein n=1 Tax=Muraenolepis orangiensis TaxID=630683 RepID=A0A9Q0E979_9TELE|nr:hypothetical protein NHX12_030942 [Muraenolepis orangiensis]